MVTCAGYSKLGVTFFLGRWNNFKYSYGLMKQENMNIMKLKHSDLILYSLNGQFAHLIGEANKINRI